MVTVLQLYALKHGRYAALGDVKLLTACLAVTGGQTSISDQPGTG